MKNVAAKADEEFQSSFKKGALLNSIQRSSSVPAELKARGRGAASGRESGPIMVSDLAVDSECAYNDAPTSKANPRSHQVGGRRATYKDPRAHKLRQSNSESMIFQKHSKKVGAHLDPRIYPSWWGDDHLESPAGPRAPSAHEKRGDAIIVKDLKKQQLPERQETSLERGIREIQATAVNLDKNLQGISSRGGGTGSKTGDI